MRVTKESLLKLAQDTIARRVRQDRSLIAAYLCGSMLEDEYSLGGTADVDLVLIHLDPPAQEREILPLTDEFHFDIAHHNHKDYRQTRQLRVHPWLGPTLNACKILFDPQHFMDFTQASVRGLFDRPDRVLQRSRKFLDSSRQIWFNYQDPPPLPGPSDVLAYLKALGYAANAIAGLTGMPLTDRRFLISFPERSQAVGKPGLSAGLLGLIGAPNLKAGQPEDLIPLWVEAFRAVEPDAASPRLQPARQNYYYKGFEALITIGQPQAALWPMLRTWTLAAAHLAPESKAYQDWTDVFNGLELLGSGFVRRLEALDAFIDVIDETLEYWAADHGA